MTKQLLGFWALRYQRNARRRRNGSTPPPAAPVATSASPVSYDGFGAHWNAVAGATSYRLDIATDSGFSTIVLNNFSTTDLTLFFDDVSTRTVYYYRVRAVGPGGTSANSNTISAETLSGLLDSLAGYWKLNEASGAGTRADSNGGGHGWSASDPITSNAGKIGNCISISGEYLFDSDTGHYQLKGSSRDFSIALWMYDPGNALATVCGLWNELDFSTSQWRIRNNGSATGFGYSDGFGSIDVPGTFGNAGDGWDFLVMTWNDAAQEVALYAAETEVMRETIPDMNGSPSVNFVFGSDNSNLSPYSGDLDECGLWHRVLTPADIAELYNSNAGRTHPFP